MKPKILASVALSLISLFLLSALVSLPMVKAQSYTVYENYTGGGGAYPGGQRAVNGTSSQAIVAISTHYAVEVQMFARLDDWAPVTLQFNDIGGNTLATATFDGNQLGLGVMQWITVPLYPAPLMTAGSSYFVVISYTDGGFVWKADSFTIYYYQILGSTSPPAASTPTPTPITFGPTPTPYSPPTSTPFGATPTPYHYPTPTPYQQITPTPFIIQAGAFTVTLEDLALIVAAIVMIALAAYNLGKKTDKKGKKGKK